MTPHWNVVHKNRLDASFFFCVSFFNIHTSTQLALPRLVPSSTTMVEIYSLIPGPKPEVAVPRFAFILSIFTFQNPFNKCLFIARVAVLFCCSISAFLVLLHCTLSQWLYFRKQRSAVCNMRAPMTCCESDASQKQDAGALCFSQ